MTAYPPTHLLNPLFRYANAHETQQPGYLAMKFARIIAEREVKQAANQAQSHGH